MHELRAVVFAIGDHLGNYEIVARLKAGGMATLFVGKRIGAAGFVHPVAIKVIHPHLAHDPEFARMFVDEAKLASRIEHPNVVHVEELGEARGTYFLAMEYVHGPSLAALMHSARTTHRPLPREMAVWIAAKIATGLHAAHETCNEQGELLGVVHRDVSPENVLITRAGHVKLGDFGIAKARGRNADGVAVRVQGKLRFMSPEQAMGGDVDRRADVYSLGVILWEMLTTRRLFEGNTDRELRANVEHPSVPPPSAFDPDIAPALEAVVMAALARDREQRPSTAQNFRQMLIDALPDALKKEATDVAVLVRAHFGDDDVLVQEAQGGEPSPSDEEPTPCIKYDSPSMHQLQQPSAASIVELASGDLQELPSAAALPPAAERTHRWVAWAGVLAVGIGGIAAAAGFGHRGSARPQEAPATTAPIVADLAPAADARSAETTASAVAQPVPTAAPVTTTAPSAQRVRAPVVAWTPAPSAPRAPVAPSSSSNARPHDGVPIVADEF